MPYTPTVWTHGVTPLNETNLNHLETQYAQAVADAVVASVERTTVASAVLRNSNDTQRSTVELVYTKKKEVLLNANLPACRIKFDMNNAVAGTTVITQIWKNGAPIGVERSSDTGEVWQTYSEDFTGFLSGNLIQIYAKTTDGAVACLVRNMRFYYDDAISKIGGISLVTPLLDTEDPTISITNQDP